MAACGSASPVASYGTVGRGAALGPLVLRFNDGEAMRGYKDEVFSHDGNCLNVMLWDDETRALCRFIVPYSALKAIFFVEQWDSRPAMEQTA